MRATLNIQTPYESRSVEIEDEISLGRTEPSDVVVDDPGLSRVNTTFFIDDGSLWVADEDSTNGTFLNGQRISGRANLVKSGDRLTIGSHTTITVEVADERAATGAPVASEAAPKASISTVPPMPPPVAAPPAADDQGGARWVIAVAAIMTVLILLFGGIAFIVVSQMEDAPGNSGGGRTTASSAISGPATRSCTSTADSRLVIACDSCTCVLLSTLEESVGQVLHEGVDQAVWVVLEERRQAGESGTEPSQLSSHQRRFFFRW